MLLGNIFGNTQSQVAAGMPEDYNRALWSARLGALGAGFANASATGQGAGYAMSQAAQEWGRIPGQLQKQQLGQMQLQEAQEEMRFRQALKNAQTPEERMSILQQNPRMASRIAEIDYRTKLQSERDKREHERSLQRIYANSGAGAARSEAERKRKLAAIEANTDLTPEEKRRIKFEIDTGVKYGSTDYTGSVKTYLQLGQAFKPGASAREAIRLGYELTKSTAGKTKQQWINEYVLRNGTSERTLRQARETADKLYGPDSTSPPAPSAPGKWKGEMDSARNAIRSGAPKDAVKKRMLERGVPKELVDSL